MPKTSTRRRTMRPNRRNQDCIPIWELLATFTAIGLIEARQDRNGGFGFFLTPLGAEIMEEP